MSSSRAASRFRTSSIKQLVSCPDYIPPLMWRNDRPEVQHFDGAESLYSRINLAAYRDAHGVRFTNLRADGDDSMNRSKFGGQPTDVLLCDDDRFRGWGVLE